MYIQDIFNFDKIVPDIENNLKMCNLETQALTVFLI